MPEWEYDDGVSWFWEEDPDRRFDDRGFGSPEEAAAPEIPARYVRVLGVKYSPDGRRAVVELLTNEEPAVHQLTVGCVRDESGLWHEDWSAG